MISRSLWRSCSERIAASSRTAISLALVGLALAATGCTVSTRQEPVYTEVDAPVGIETYPQTTYEGRPVYYYQNRWYFRHGQRWTYYREEPPALRQHRTRVEVRHEVRREDRREERREENHH